MYWRILPYATATIISGKVILLDIRQDRYFLAPDRVGPVLAAWLEAKDGNAPPAPIIGLLHRSGIARPGDAAPSNTVTETISIPASLAVARYRTAPTTGERLHIALLVIATRLALRIRPLARILRYREQRLIYRAPGKLDHIRERADLYDQARALLPVARGCLLDSLALDSWLACEDLGCQLVFGVTVQPFVAHCWLQTQQAVLNDGYDRVSRFTPILAL